MHNVIVLTVMNKRKCISVLVFSATLCVAREPFKPRDGALPFLVYYMSRYRGLCVGTLVSRTAVLTAAICIVDPTSNTHDTRPINVVTGATYRHPRRGIRVQVTKIIIPKLSNVTGNRVYMIQTSPALLLLARKVPDILAEIPLRPIGVHYKGEDALALHEECLMAGWHFFYKGDKIYPTLKFLLQRNIRVQYLVIVKKSLWCSTISLKFQKAMTNLGYSGYFDEATSVCVRDPDRQAQPCHGMYGAPLICRGNAAGILMAPDAQWANCTGYSNMVELLSSGHIRNFMDCISKYARVCTGPERDKTSFIKPTSNDIANLFEPEFNVNWDSLKKSLEAEVGEQQFDYLPDLYDRMVYGESSYEEV